MGTMRLILCIFCLISFTQTLNVYSKSGNSNYEFHEKQSAIDELNSKCDNLEASLTKLNNNLSKINNNVKDTN